MSEPENFLDSAGRDFFCRVMSVIVIVQLGDSYARGSCMVWDGLKSVSILFPANFAVQIQILGLLLFFMLSRVIIGDLQGCLGKCR